MNDHVQNGFLKAAGIGELFSGAMTKIKGLFGGGGGGGSVGAQIVKRGPRPMQAVRQATVPKMQVTHGGGSTLPIKPHAPTATNIRNTAIRADMKAGLRAGGQTP